MILTITNVFEYMCDLGYASPQEVVNREYRVRNLTRRNFAFQVSCRSRPDYVIKQVITWNPWQIGLSAAELQWFRMVADHPRFAAMRQFFPNCRHRDDANRIVVFELPAVYEDVVGQAFRIGRISSQTACILGQTLSAFHRSVMPEQVEETNRYFQKTVPFGVSWILQDWADIGDANSALRDLHAFVTDHRIFRETITDLRESLDTKCFINGDLKFVHCILTNDGKGAGAIPTQGQVCPSLYLIDWESGGIGDRVADIGAILREYLVLWQISKYRGGGERLFPLEEMQAAVREFWRSYSVDMTDPERDETVDRAIVCAVAYLIQTANQLLAADPTDKGDPKMLADLALKVITLSRGQRREMLGV